MWSQFRSRSMRCRVFACGGRGVDTAPENWWGGGEVREKGSIDRIIDQLS